MNVEVLIGKQSVKDAEATIFFKLQATDYNISNGTNVVNSSALTGSRFKGGKSFVSKINITGGIPVEFTAQSLLMIMAGSGFTLDGLPVADVQAYKAKESVDDLYTIVLNNKKDGCYEKSMNCKITSVDLNLAVDSFVTGTMNVIGEDSVFDGTKAFDGTVQEFVDEQLICLDSNATKAGTDITAKLTSVTFSVNNNLEAKFAINDIYCSEIVEGNAEISGNITYNKFDKTIYGAGFTELKANTSSVVAVKLGTDATKVNYIEFVFPKATPTSNEGGDWAGTGSLTQAYSFNYDKVTGTALKINAKGVVEPTYL